MGGIGTYDEMQCSDSDDYYLVYPGWGIVVYRETNYTKVTLSITLAYQNNTGYPQIVKPTNSNAGKSMRVYFDNVEIEL